MRSDKQSSTQSKSAPGRSEKSRDPEWAAGLKQLYDSVVDEELPDTFKDLLAELDSQPSDDGAGSSDGSAR